MTRLPVRSGAEGIRAFARAGWIEDRRRGSHVTLIKPGTVAILTVPLHDELDRGALRTLIRRAGLTVDEFFDLLG